MRLLLIIGLMLASGAQAQDAPAASAPVTLEQLIGLSEADVRERLGEPALARREDQASMWTYRRASCALYVYFRSEGREGFRVVGASTGPRRRGEAAPSVDDCLASERGQSRAKEQRTRRA